MEEKIIFQKVEKVEEEGEEIEIFITCEEKEATHKLITYPNSIDGFNQEIPSKRVKI